MYPVSSELYRQVAALLAQAVGSRSYFSGSVEGETEGAAWRLTASVIVYSLGACVCVPAAPGSRL